MRTITALLTAAILLAGCGGEINIYSETEVNYYPSRQQEKHPRGIPTYSCTSVGAIHDLLENGYITKGCGYRPMTAHSYRDDFYTEEGVRYRIIQFQIDFITYYSFEETNQRYR